MVGFNRRFAPMTARMKSFLAPISEPLALHYRVNAGYLPPDHWVNDREQGGGRILGEVCHFVDLLMFLAGSPIVEVEARAIGNAGRYSGDNVAGLAAFCQRFRGNDQLSREWRSIVFQGADRSVRRGQHGGSRRFSPARTCARRAERNGPFALAPGQGTSRRSGLHLRSRCRTAAYRRFLSRTWSAPPLRRLRIEKSLATGKRLAVDTSAFLEAAQQTSDLNSSPNE